MESNYSLKKLIEILGKNQFALLLRLILDRFPVIIIGEEQNEVDTLLSGLINLASNNRLIQNFGSDFFEQDEYMQLCQEEENDFNIPRIIFCSPSNASKHIFNRIDRLKGWIIGFEESNGLSKEQIIENVQRLEPQFLIMIIRDTIKIELMGINNNSLNLNFEKNLIDKAIQKTEIALEKMKRVLKKRIKAPPSNDVMAAIMRFDSEEEKIEMNIFIQEIQSFVQAGMRSLAILSRIDLLRELGFDPTISGKTLLQTIDYDEVDADRILQLIQAEYGVDFSSCIKGGRSVAIGDKIDGFWG